jgi:hypothetical protein
MNKRVKKELIRCLNRPITKKIAYLIIDGPVKSGASVTRS